MGGSGSSVFEPPVQQRFVIIVIEVFVDIRVVPLCPCSIAKPVKKLIDLIHPIARRYGQRKIALKHTIQRATELASDIPFKLENLLSRDMVGVDVDAEIAASFKNYRMSVSVLDRDDISSGHIERQTW